MMIQKCAAEVNRLRIALNTQRYRLLVTRMRLVIRVAVKLAKN